MKGRICRARINPKETRCTNCLLGCLFIITMPCNQSESESEVTQSCLTLHDPMDCSPPGFSVHGILQATVLEWVAISFSRGSSQPRDRTQVSHIAGRRFNLWATREVKDDGKLQQPNSGRTRNNLDLPGMKVWVIYVVHQNPSFFAEIGKLVLKFIWKYKGPRIAKAIFDFERTKLKGSDMSISKLTTRH